MNDSSKGSAAQSGPGRLRWIFWIFAAIALVVLLLEHRAHVLGWGLHALLALCVVLLYLAIRADAVRGGDRPG